MHCARTVTGDESAASALGTTPAPPPFPSLLMDSFNCQLLYCVCNVFSAPFALSHCVFSPRLLSSLARPYQSSAKALGNLNDRLKIIIAFLSEVEEGQRGPGGREG